LHYADSQTVASTLFHIFNSSIQSQNQREHIRQLTAELNNLADCAMICSAHFFSTNVSSLMYWYQL